MPACSKAERFAEIAQTLGIPADYGKTRRLKLQREAREQDLRQVGETLDGREVLLEWNAASAWKAMSRAAERLNVTLIPLSGFRSIDRQVEIIRRKLAAGEAIESILKLVAAPGYSEHHSGRAVDIGTPGERPLEESFAATEAFRWLERHAGEFEFSLSYPAENEHGIAYEPWHWRFR